MRLRGYRWRAGTHTAADVGEDYAVERFATHLDMRGNVRWYSPNSGADVITPAAIEQALDGTQREYGLREFTWKFPFLTPQMQNWLWTQKMGSVPSAAATVRTFNRSTGAWEFYTCTALWPTPDTLRGLELKGGGWVEFPIRFILATKL